MRPGAAAEDGPAVSTTRGRSLRLLQERYLAYVLAGNRDGAQRLVRRLRHDEISVTTLVEGILRTAQQEVGLSWQKGTLTVADEHAASAIIEVTLTIATIGAPVGGRGPVYVACAEGEWHALPARMVGELLRVHGWHVISLGASVPADQLAAYLRRRRMLALLVSVSTPLALPGARRLAEAAAAAGVPVLAGGAAFGDDPRRAAAIGANGWAADAGDADRLLSRWVVGGAPAPPAPAASWSGDFASLVDRRGNLLDLLRPAVADLVPWHLHGTVTEYTGFLVDALAAAVLVDDPAVFTGYAGWLGELWQARGVHPDVLATLWPPLLAALDDAPVATLTVRMAA